MISMLLAIGNLARAFWRGLKEPEFRALLMMVVIILIIGTLFYARFEGWTWVDSLYFSVTTLATVGFGDLAPTHPGTKIFTVFYILSGLGILLAFIQRIAFHMTDRPEKKAASHPQQSSGEEKPS